MRTSPFTHRPEALGVVGSGYLPLQNEEHAEFLNLLADESTPTWAQPVAVAYASDTRTGIRTQL